MKHMASLRALSVFVGMVGVASCSKPAPPAVDEGTVRARAQAAIAPYKGALKGELTAAMADGGAPSAVDVCSTRAPALAAEHSKAGIRVGRSAKKLRTPADAPPPWLVPVMDDLAKAPSGSSDARVVRLPGDRWGYAEPIWIQPPCLACHGESLAPEVDARLRARYPADDARGFKAGDFRGVFYAELDATAVAR